MSSKEPFLQHQRAEWADGEAVCLNHSAKRDLASMEQNHVPEICALARNLIKRSDVPSLPDSSSAIRSFAELGVTSLQE